jgi:hypothetical protein
MYEDEPMMQLDNAENDYEEDDESTEMLPNSAKKSTRKRVRLSKRKKSNRPIEDLKKLPTTSGRASFWKNRFVTDHSAKK